jgi:UDP-N-acetyl-D-mannosaminuronic acid dehydrogenase
MKTFNHINIIGLGYIGLPTAAIIAKSNIKVTGVDINQNVIDIINSGKIHIEEPFLEGVVKNVVSKGLFKAQLTPCKADAYVIAVPTPFKDNFEPDISYINDAINNLAPFMEKDSLIIIESTSPVYTTEKTKKLLDKLRPDLKNNYYLAYCPERVLPGQVLRELVENDRVIGGINNESTLVAKSFYRKFVNGKLHKTNSKTAELCKLTENSYRDANIAFANELSIIADKANINIWDLIRLSNKHPRVDILSPGPGVGGHCIAVDPWFIISEFQKESILIKSSRKVNLFKTKWVKEKIKNTILEFINKNNKKPKVALLGLAFKPNIDDLRESPALEITLSTLKNQHADYIISEPYKKEFKNINLTDYKKAYIKADIVVFLVGHKFFKDIAKDNSKIELDFCGIRQNL